MYDACACIRICMEDADLDPGSKKSPKISKKYPAKLILKILNFFINQTVKTTGTYRI